MRGYCLGICMAVAVLAGCSQMRGKAALEEANGLFSQGSYPESAARYEEILKKYPELADKALFEMGIMYAYAKNEQREYPKATKCFQQVVEEFPASPYRHDSEMMIFYISSAAVKDDTIARQQKQIVALRQEMGTRGEKIALLEKKIEALEQKLFAMVLRQGSADRILVEKKERRLTLLSRGEAIKTYKIALGGNPDGPKEREGDNKTPEGSYVIDSRLRDSRFHLGLHISYPNEKDRKRARELGVPPGGNIMIHGIKKGFSWVGASHTDVDWTQGCIAVTDDEIDEIGTLAPNGTVVEIRP